MKLRLALAALLLLGLGAGAWLAWQNGLEPVPLADGRKLYVPAAPEFQEELARAEVLLPAGPGVEALLLTADRVRGPSVGPKGRVPPQVWATIELSRQPDLACAAAWILKRAPLPGRIYALGALWLGDKPHFQSLSVDYSELPAPVLVTFGLVDSEVRAADLVSRLRTGELPEAWSRATEPLSAEDDDAP